MGNTEGALKPETVLTKQERIAELARTNRQMAFTSLNGFLDADWLRYAYDQTRKDGAVGVDGQTAEAYAENLEANLADLLDRLKSGRYQAPPVRRVFIPKAGSATEKRPLGIPAFEDKVAQRAVVMLLEAIYEQDFRGCSFGFRRGRSAHQAIQHLRNRIMDRGGRWILDVDLRRYFDSIDHAKLRELLARRVVDGVVRRLIDKWLKAGVLADGQLHRSSTGTPQGGVISPLLANVYLHYVLDEWFYQDVEPRMKGRCSLERFRDDFRGLLAAAKLSISYAGYNTVTDLMRARVPAVLVSYSGEDGGETEQANRTARLGEYGMAAVLRDTELSPEALAGAIETALALPQEMRHDLNLDGARRTVELLLEWGAKS